MNEKMWHHHRNFKKLCVSWKVLKQHKWQNRYHDKNISTQHKRKESQLRGVSLVLSKLVSIPLLVCCGWACSSTRTQARPSPVLNMQLKEQQMAALSRWLRVGVLSCVNTSTRAWTVYVLVTGDIIHQLSRGKCVKESHEAGKHDLAHVNRSHGNEWSTKRRIEERGKRSLGRKITTRDDETHKRRVEKSDIINSEGAVWTHVWEESSVDSRITGVQLRPALVHSFSWAAPCVSWVLHEPLNRWQLHYFLVINQ